MGKEYTFEQAYERLEAILEKMNSDTVSLDNALALYEEADSLITSCQKKLSDAESKVEILLKNREGKVQTNDQGTPQTQPFTSTRQASLKE